MTLRNARCNDKESQSAISLKNSRHVLLKETIIVRCKNSLKDTQNWVDKKCEFLGCSTWHCVHSKH